MRVVVLERPDGTRKTNLRPIFNFLFFSSFFFRAKVPPAKSHRCVHLIQPTTLPRPTTQRVLTSEPAEISSSSAKEGAERNEGEAMDSEEDARSDAEEQSSSQSSSANSDSEQDEETSLQPQLEGRSEGQDPREGREPDDEQPSQQQRDGDQEMQDGGGLPRPATTLPVDELTTYLSAVSSRRAHFLSPPSTPVPSSYSIESIATISHSTHVHSMAVPPCSSHIFTGGQDGFIRRYALHPMLNGTGIDNPLFTNFTMKPPGTWNTPPAEARLPVLVGYWENEEPGSWMDELKSKQEDQGGESAGGGTDEDPSERLRWGPKTSNLSSQSPVYSLAVQREEVFGLSGTAVSSQVDQIG